MIIMNDNILKASQVVFFPTLRALNMVIIKMFRFQKSVSLDNSSSFSFLFLKFHVKRTFNNCFKFLVSFLGLIDIAFACFS